MKKLFWAGMLALLAIPAGAAVSTVFPPASQAETDAGASSNKFVSPYTLTRSSALTGGATNGIPKLNGLGTNTTLYSGTANGPFYFDVAQHEYITAQPAAISNLLMTVQQGALMVDTAYGLRVTGLGGSNYLQTGVTLGDNMDAGGKGITNAGMLTLPAETPGATNGIYAGTVPVIRVITAQAGGGGQSAGNNVFIGGAGSTTLTNPSFSTEASYNVAIGKEAMASASNASTSVAIGYRSLYSNTSGWANNAVGIGTLYHNTSASFNTAMGDQSLYNNTIGSFNTAYGDQSMFYNTTGSNNTGLGRGAMTYNDVGGDNTAIGHHSMYFNTNGSINTALGLKSLEANTSGGDNTAIGAYALRNNLTGDHNVALGFFAGSYETLSHYFYVDNQLRTDLVGSRTNALMFGKFDADSANQFLSVNARLGVNNTNPACALDVKGPSFTVGQELAKVGTDVSGNTMRLMSAGDNANILVALQSGVLNLGAAASGSETNSIQARGGAQLATSIGRVAIGNVNPQAELDVTGDIRASTTMTATQGFSSDGIHFIQMPTNTSSDTYVLTASSTPGITKWAAQSGGSGYSSIDGSNVVAGTVSAARLGSGSSITTKFLRGDNTWQTVTGAGALTNVAYATGTNAISADSANAALNIYPPDGADRIRLQNDAVYINGSNAVSIGVTGADYTGMINAFYADRTGATTVGVPNGVVTLQGTVNGTIGNYTANGVSTAIASNSITTGSITTSGSNYTAQAGAGAMTITGTLTATNPVFYAPVIWGDGYQTNKTYTDSTGWHNTNTTAASQGVWITKGNLSTDGAITNGGGTASTFVVHDANKKLIGSAASSVLATTLTDETGSGVVVFGTSPTFTTDLTTPQTLYTTNSGSAVSPNMAVSYALLSTNAAFAMLLPTGVDSGQTKVQTSVLMVTNTTATAVAITAAVAPVKSTGTWYVTNVSAITTTVYPKVVTNMICLPIF